MAKETYYFSHDYNPTSDPKIQALIGEHGAIGYGIYWRIVEMLHEDNNHKLELKKYIYIALAKQMSTSVEQVQGIVEDCINVYELFCSDEMHFWSERVMRNIDKRSEISSKRSKAGKISAENRKKTTQVEQVPTHVEQIPTKEIKEKEIKVKENSIKIEIESAFPFNDFWELYDKKVGDKAKLEKKWQQISEPARLLIKEHIPKYKESQPEKKFRKDPQTYLNNKSWNDEIITETIISHGNKSNANSRNSKSVHPNDPIFCGVEK